jgi:DNA-binding MarR family transcriptional regulator
MNKADQLIKQKIMQVINKAIFNEKKKIFNYEGVSLYPSEIHLMLAIKNGINTNATHIAKRLGITKGAVSQTLSRLEKKGMIQKTKNPYNKNELTISLTGFGKKAYELCLSTEARFMAAHDQYLKALSQSGKDTIIDFLRHMEGAMDD